MATVNWANSTAPIVTLRKEDDYPRERFDWSSTRVFVIGAADTLRLRVRFDHNSTGDLEGVVTIKKLDVQNNEIDTLATIYKIIDAHDQHSEYVYLPIGGDQIFRFKIHAKILESRTMAGTEYWIEAETIFTAFVQFVGDFSLDYIPITLLYCPPEQDMTNALLQSMDYQTVVTLGTSELVGSETTTSQSVRGGVSIQTPYIGAGQSVSGESTSQSGSSLENSSRNSVAFRYTWNTKLIADNQRAIGRAFWGPLGDIFVLLKNPWFTLRGDENGMSLTVNEYNTSLDTEILILPAHKLLRPGNDLIARDIPAETRRRLLELDPFITNLDLFFSPAADGSGELEDLGAPLEVAADPYADPSPGNRAALLAKYRLSAGVVLDLSATEEVEVADVATNETVYYSRVTNTVGIDTSLSFLAGLFTFGSSIGFSSSEYMRVSYLASNETRARIVKTAQCSLIRNQNAVDLSDIEIWWDKHFSTFMFRKTYNFIHHMKGSAYDPKKNILRNAPVELVLVEMDQPFSPGDSLEPAYRRFLSARGLDPDKPPRRPRVVDSTMTNEKGIFEFKNIPVLGTYRIECGDVSKTVKINRRTDIAKGPIRVALNNVKRTVNLRTSPLWELAEALEVSDKKARAVRRALVRRRRLNARAVDKVLRDEGLDINELRTVANLKYSAPRRR